MKKIDTDFEGLYLLKNDLLADDRGLFIKTFSISAFNQFGLNIDFKEEYYSVSKKDVIRGMHFQIPPYDHIKLVNVISGAILDVIVDLRKNSPTFKQVFSIELNEQDGKCLYIPKGFAHGFKSLEENSVVKYFQTSEYNKDCDKGILWNSFGFDWKIKNPILSVRDAHFPSLADFDTPF